MADCISVMTQHYGFIILKNELLKLIMTKILNIRLITLCLGLGFMTNAISQDIIKGDKNFGISLGLNDYQIRETILNNIRHRGLLLSLGLSNSRLKDKSYKEFNFNIIVNKLKTRYETEKLSLAANPLIKYRYLRKVKNFNENFNLFIGGITGWNLHLGFYEEWDESHIYWLNSYFLGIDERLIFHSSEKSTISLDINIPIVSLISRPPKRFLYKEINPKLSWFLNNFHDDLKLASLNQHFEYNMIFEYKFWNSKKYKKIIFWHFSYLKNTMPHSKDLSILTNTFGIKLTF